MSNIEGPQQFQALPPEVARLAGELNVHPLIAEILVQRGYGEPEAARRFLDAGLYRPQPPEALPGVRAATEIVRRALEAGRRILVWGDFDVDGQTATALLVQAFDDLGGGRAPIGYHIPVRAAEGHGVGAAKLEEYLAADAPPDLIVTCDTGITAFDALELARARGVAVVVTDHHEPAHVDGAPRLPPADAIVTPRLLPPGHPLAGLPGVGVAYKLVEALYEIAGRPEDAEAYLDLAALGIVADVADQTGDTRYLLQLGLRRLRQTSRPGLLAIYERAALKAESLNEEHVGFVLGPRLNALGRLGDANPAVELLTTPDPGRARLLALQLEGLNARRQLLTSQTLRAALGQVEADPSLLDGDVLTLAHPTWEPGIIGIVAGRLAERFERPVALIAAPTGLPGRGSARSTPGVHITEALAANAGLLRSFGGHALAAGFAVDAENIPALRRGLSRAAAAQRRAQSAPVPGAQVFAAPLEPGEARRVDARVDWNAIGPELAAEIERLAPFGPGNPPPALASPGVTPVGQAAIGREGEHLALRLAGPDGSIQRALWWGGADFAAQFPLPPGPFDAVFTLRSTAYRGAPQAQLEWLGYRRPAEAHAEQPAIRVDDFRGQAHPLGALQAWLAENGDPEDMFIWAEGDARRALAEHPALEALVPQTRLGGRDEIPGCRALAVWTAPPGAAELASALRRSGAQRVALFAVDPGMDGAQAFLERLAGAARSVLRLAAGDPSETEERRASLARLAAVTAQREAAVRLGLAWMEAQGYLQARLEDGQAVLLPGAPAAKDPERAAARLGQLRELLAETRAYRAFFRSASPEALQLAMPAAGGQQDGKS